MKRTFLISLFSLFALLPLVAHADEVSLSQTVQASQTAVYQLELHNETAAAHDYALALSGLPKGLTVTYSQGGPLVNSVAIRANDYILITIQVAVPVETAVAHYDAQFSATRDDGEIVNQQLTLNVENTYALKIASQSLNVSAFSGQEFGFEVTAVNSGAAAITNVVLTVDAPAKWIVQSNPVSVAMLEPSAETTFQASVLVPSSQVSIDQQLHLTLTSDQTSSPESSLMVRVQKSPTFIYIALGLMALAITAVVIYFRRKGRR